MNNTLEAFKNQQANTLELLNKLHYFLNRGNEVGVNVDPALISKLQNVIHSLSGDKLKVALIGGFSEGKTSIASAWMEKLDKSSMKISHKESSNEVKVYEVGEDFVLIDTPGLFGFKEQHNADTGKIEKYKEITKKYVSEAHLVLYVMNPTNPIKESHKDDLNWLFRTLDLLPRTVFVLSRFDEVADVEDERDYQGNLQIKRANVVSRLKDLIYLTEQEASDLSIVAVAANPFDLGVDHWLANAEQFKVLSHIAALQNATTEKIKKNGGSAALVAEMRTSVVRDVLNNQLPVAIENDQKVTLEVKKLEELNGRITMQIGKVGREIEDARNNLRAFAMRYFSDLILQTKGSSLETFSDFFEREIGKEGIIISTRLQEEFSHQTQSINLEIQKMQVSFNNEVNHFDTTVKALGKQGINHIIKTGVINNKTVLATRDGVSSIAKTMGIDIGKFLKFKSYGAINLAKSLNGALAVLGVAIEVWDSCDKYQKQEAFAKAIKRMVNDFEEQRQDFLDLINSDDFKKNFFTDYLLLDKRSEELKQELDQAKGRHLLFSGWRKEAEGLNNLLLTFDKQ